HASVGSSPCEIASTTIGRDAIRRGGDVAGPPPALEARVGIEPPACGVGPFARRGATSARGKSCLAGAHGPLTGKCPVLWHYYSMMITRPKATTVAGRPNQPVPLS